VVVSGYSLLIIPFYRSSPLKTSPLVGQDERGSLPRGDYYVYKQLYVWYNWSMHGRTNHCIYNINYHIVFCPKFRYKIIKGMMEDIVKLTIQEICTTTIYTIIQMEAMPDHPHIFLSAPPTVAPTEIVTKLKSITANKVFAAFPNLENISGAVDCGAGATISV
jgi:putative transposase